MAQSQCLLLPWEQLTHNTPEGAVVPSPYTSVHNQHQASSPLRVNSSRPISKSYVNPLGLLIGHLQHIIDAQPKYGVIYRAILILQLSTECASLHWKWQSSVLMTWHLLRMVYGLLTWLSHKLGTVIYQNIRVGYHYNFFDNLGNEYPTYHRNGTF